jgi:hypothetical protein
MKAIHPPSTTNPPFSPDIASKRNPQTSFNNHIDNPNHHQTTTKPTIFPFLFNPYLDDPTNYTTNYTTTLDRRTHPGTDFGKRQAIGDGATHHDILNFSLTKGSENTADTLIVRHHVRACHFRGLSTAIVMLLLADLLDLQDERRLISGVVRGEMLARGGTIRTMEEVLDARAEWSVDDGGEGGDKKEGDGVAEGKEES